MPLPPVLIGLLQRPATVIALALAAGMAPAAGQPSGAAPVSFQAAVLSVGDGDTLRVSRAGQLLTIRLACIDAPEMAQTPWGPQSRAYLMQRLSRGRMVTIRPHTTDRYGRMVAEVISDININLVMVEDGQAFAYRRYLSGCDAREYLDAEFRASRRRYGVWQMQGGITRPWDFRQLRTAARFPDGTTPDGLRYRCKEIGSYARAQVLLRKGHTYLDSNGDGEACESHTPRPAGEATTLETGARTRPINRCSLRAGVAPERRGLDAAGSLMSILSSGPGEHGRLILVAGDCSWV
ncbi:MAG: thermonuclease family protein [Prochlorococcaceae cyanobacterium]